VICNPDVTERPSPSPSANSEKPISTAAAVSRDFSILALSTSQTSIDNPVSNGDYIVPNEVAAAVANNEEQRRQALAGLVDGLFLEESYQAMDVPTNNIHMPHSSQPAPRTHWNQYPAQEPDDNADDDDTFFSRLSIHNDKDSLMEEPEPQAEAGFGHDEDFGFDDELSESQDDSDTKDEEENELPPAANPKICTSKRVEQCDR
jgi:hypothetical protein